MSALPNSHDGRLIDRDGQTHAVELKYATGLYHEFSCEARLLGSNRSARSEADTEIEATRSAMLNLVDALVMAHGWRCPTEILLPGEPSRTELKAENDRLRSELTQLEATLAELGNDYDSARLNAR